MELSLSNTDIKVNKVKMLSNKITDPHTLVRHNMKEFNSKIRCYANFSKGVFKKTKKTSKKAKKESERLKKI